MDGVIFQIGSASPQEHKVKNQPMLGPSQATDPLVIWQGFPLDNTATPSYLSRPASVQCNTVVEVTGLGREMCFFFSGILGRLSASLHGVNLG